MPCVVLIETFLFSLKKTSHKFRMTNTRFQYFPASVFSLKFLHIFTSLKFACALLKEVCQFQYWWLPQYYNEYNSNIFFLKIKTIKNLYFGRCFAWIVYALYKLPHMVFPQNISFSKKVLLWKNLWWSSIFVDNWLILT